MKLKIISGLEPEQVESSFKNIQESPNDLVARVLAEETDFKTECENLITYNKEEFYQKKDELIDALNLYEFNDTVSDKKKDLLEYDLFYEELKKLNKKKGFLKKIAWGSFPTAASFTTTAGLLFGPPGAFVVGGCSLAVSMFSTIFCVDILEALKRKPPKEFITLKSYYDVRRNSEKADNFMYDLKILKEKSPDMYTFLTGESLNKNLLLPFYEENKK